MKNLLEYYLNNDTSVKLNKSLFEDLVHNDSIVLQRTSLPVQVAKNLCIPPWFFKGKKFSDYTDKEAKLYTFNQLLEKNISPASVKTNRSLDVVPTIRIPKHLTEDKLLNNYLVLDGNHRLLHAANNMRFNVHLVSAVIIDDTVDSKALLPDLEYFYS